MKLLPAVAALTCACALNVALAADTPGAEPNRPPPPPPVAKRLSDARAMIEAKNWSAALSELQSAARQEPRNAEVHNLLGYAYRKRATPDLPKAFEHYRTALRLEPRHKGAHEYIGEAYLMDKQPAEAEKHLAELEKICGNKSCEEYQDLAKALEQYKAGR